jgi:hypothetical protein
MRPKLVGFILIIFFGAGVIFGSEVVALSPIMERTCDDLRTIRRINFEEGARGF